MGHDLVGLGEVMLRLAAPPPQRLDQAVALDVQIGGSEANVMAAVSRLGLRTAFISALPSDHAWGDRTVRELSGHGVDCAGILRRPASRMGLYFLEYGSPPRPVRVLYDRRDSAMSQLVPDEVEWTFVRGARMVHLSGITAALGENLRAVLRRASAEAQAARVPLSFDVNYRSRLWSAKEARDFLTEILPGVRYLFIGSDDAETVFELSGAARTCPRWARPHRSGRDHRLDPRRSRLRRARGRHGATALATVYGDHGGSGGRGRRLCGRISLGVFFKDGPFRRRWTRRRPSPPSNARSGATSPS